MNIIIHAGMRKLVRDAGSSLPIPRQDIRISEQHRRQQRKGKPRRSIRRAVEGGHGLKSPLNGGGSGLGHAAETRAKCIASCPAAKFFYHAREYSAVFAPYFGVFITHGNILSFLGSKKVFLSRTGKFSCFLAGNTLFYHAREISPARVSRP